jgi:hypothetical protein
MQIFLLSHFPFLYMQTYAIKSWMIFKKDNNIYSVLIGAWISSIENS